MGGVLYRRFGRSDILGDFLKFSKKSFGSVRLFSFPNFWAKKKSKSDFRTPLAGGPNVRYNTPPIDQGIFNLPESTQKFRISNFGSNTA